MRKNRLIISLLIILSVFLFSACSAGNKLQDGYYTAIAKDYSHGWKEYVTVLVKTGEIISIEYNARDESGYIKAWDSAYMKDMKPIAGTYPNEYTRKYSSSIIDTQDPSQIDMVTGATHSGKSFTALMTTIVENAKIGNHDITIVDTEEGSAD